MSIFFFIIVNGFSFLLPLPKISNGKGNIFGEEERKGKTTKEWEPQIFEFFSILVSFHSFGRPPAIKIRPKNGRTKSQESRSPEAVSTLWPSDTIGYDRWLDPFFSFQPTFGRNLLLLVRHGDSFWAMAILSSPSIRPSFHQDGYARYNPDGRSCWGKKKSQCKCL
mgnify:CR=1 FL=1